MNTDKIIDMFFELENAIISGNLSSLWQENDQLKECWVELKCDKENCPAFGRPAIRCWQVSGTFCTHGLLDANMVNKWDQCQECNVFTKSTKTKEDRIKELINNIIFALRCFDPASLRIIKIKKNLDKIITHYKLTIREKEVLLLILDKSSRKDISETLNISLETVKMHFKHIYKKLQVHSINMALKVLDKFCSGSDYVDFPETNDETRPLP